MIFTKLSAVVCDRAQCVQCMRLTQLAMFAHVGGGAVALEVSVQVAAGTSVLARLHGTVVHIWAGKSTHEIKLRGRGNMSSGVVYVRGGLVVRVSRGNEENSKLVVHFC